MHVKMIGAAVLAGVLLGGGSSLASAESRFGAIAYSDSTLSFGAATGELSREYAQEAAVAACNQRDCKAKLWFRNACGALAVGARGGYGTGWGVDQATADRWALQTCGRFTQGCQVRHRACTNPGAANPGGGAD